MKINIISDDTVYQLSDISYLGCIEIVVSIFYGGHAFGIMT